MFSWPVGIKFVFVSEKRFKLTQAVVHVLGKPLFGTQNCLVKIG